MILDYLETMVKGSLQIMTEGVEHENTSKIELTTMLKAILKKEEIIGLPIKIDFEENNFNEGTCLPLERLIFKSN